MPRGAFLLGVGLALVSGVFTITDQSLGRHPALIEMKIARITPGMTKTEVETLLDGLGRERAVDYGNPHVVDMSLHPARYALMEGTTYRISTREWIVRGGTVVVSFGARGCDQPRVLGNPALHRTTAPNLLDRLRSWFNW
jgi:hypothetical protein